MSIEVKYSSGLKTVETLDVNVPAASSADKTVTHDGFDTSLEAMTGTYCAYFTLALVDGAATVDLRALTGTYGVTIDGNGLKVKGFRVKNLGANALTITPGAANGIDLFGASSSVTLNQNDEITLKLNAAPSISATDKTLDCAGTGTQTSRWTIIIG